MDPNQKIAMLQKLRQDAMSRMLPAQRQQLTGAATSPQEIAAVQAAGAQPQPQPTDRPPVEGQHQPLADDELLRLLGE